MSAHPQRGSPKVSEQLHIVRQVLRRVRYASNTLALQNNSLPSEGLYDAALTNGLIAIVASDWPGEQIKNENTGMTKSASELLTFIEDMGGYTYLKASVLRDGLRLTQPVRHGRADDEFAVLQQAHLNALELLDKHPDLSFLDTARGKTIDECFRLAFLDVTESELPFDPKDRLEVPEPEICPECCRSTFLPIGWDAFGGTMTSGECLACGYRRSDEDAWEQAVDDAVAYAVERDD
jgi:hypothetical protein